MAVLSTLDRARTLAQWMRINAASMSITKAQLAAAVDATDQWIEDQQATYNAALPTAARNGMTLAQKTLIFCAVAERRAGRFHAEEDG